LEERLNKKNVCPGLGLVYDQSDHRSFPNLHHNCYLQIKPEEISFAYQETYCLSHNYIHCPIYLKKTPLITPETTPVSSENLKPDRYAFKLSTLQSLTLITILLSLVLIILLVVLTTNSKTSQQPISASSNNLMVVITFIITPTQVTPNATWYAHLTQQALSDTPTLSDFFPTRTSVAYRIPTVINCDKPDGWIVYKVDDGDSLQSLGRLTYMTVVDLMVANCMTSNSLAVGQQIFLPYYPGSATATRTARPTSTRTPSTTTTKSAFATSIPILPSATLPPPAIATNTIVPTITKTRNPLFANTPTPSNTPQPTATNPPPPTDTNTPIPVDTATP
jgi:LysM repeat protein